MQKFSAYIISLLIIFIPLYPKFPLLGVAGTFVSVRIEDFLIAFSVLAWILNRKFSQSGLHRSIILYLGIGFAALFCGVFLTKSAGLNLGLLHFLRRVEYMSVFFIAYDFLKSKADLSFIIRTLLLTSFLVALFGLGQQFMKFPVISTTNSEFSKGLALSLGPGARINSTFAGHYDLAAFNVIPLLLLISLLTLAKTPKEKTLLFIVTLPIYWSLLLSASRITFAGFFLSAAFLIWFLRRRIWLVPLVIVAVISVIASPQLRGRYFNLIVHVQAEESRDVNSVPDALKPPEVPEDRSFNIRLKAEWPRALRSFYKNPFFGTGYSSVGLAVDNDYLRALAETGLVGFVAFFMIFARYFKASWGFISNYKPSINNAFILGVSFSVISLLLNALFIDIFEASKVAIITWLLIGLSAKAQTLHEK